MRKTVIFAAVITLIFALVFKTAIAEVPQYLDPSEETSTLLSDDFVVSAGGYLTEYNGAGGDIVIPDGAVRICSNVFLDNASLTGVVFPASTEYIDNNAFANCTNLSKITIPSSLVSCSGGFAGCNNLKELNIFYGSGLTKLDNMHLSPGFKETIETINIQEGITEIGAWFFDGFAKLTSVTLPDSLEIIGQNAFSFCVSLESVTVPDGVTTIGGRAFEGCTGLSSIEIPESVTNIDYYAFGNCDNLVIYGYTFSYAETYAREESIPFTSIGQAPPKDSDFVVVNGVLTDYLGPGGNLLIPNHLGITSIGDWAFGNCTGLTAVTIPESITRIESTAFRGCTNLTDVNIPDTLTYIGEYAFEGCAGLTQISIPNSTLFLGRGAFLDCIGLTEVSVSNNTDYDNLTVFENCPNLKILNLRLGNSTVLTNKIVQFRYSVEKITIADGYTEIGYEAFFGFEKLTSVNIPDSVTRIGDYAFMNCAKLNEITIPNSVFEIGEAAFEGCTGLRTVEIPDSVTIFKYGAFQNCTNLTGVTIPESVVEMGNYVFSDCPKLSEVTIYNGTPGITPDTFFGCPTFKTLNILHSDRTSTGTLSRRPAKAEKINLGEGITAIEDEVFQSMLTLENITFPGSLQTIGRKAFAGCTNLQGIVFPANIKSIGYYAFEDCRSLQSITIPNSIESIGTGAFKLYTTEKFRELNITLGTGTTEISGNMYPFADTVNRVLIAKGITSIGPYAFQSFYRAAITIPETVTGIDYTAFDASAWSPTLHVMKNSYPHMYAVEQGIPFVLTGGERGTGSQIDSSKISTVNIIVKDQASKNIVANASVILNGVNQTTNETGATDFVNVSNGPIPIIVTADGYGAYHSNMVVANPHVTQTIYLYSDNQPRAASLTVSVNGIGRNLLSQSNFCVDTGNEAIYELTAFIDWRDQSQGAVKLTGGGISRTFTDSRLSIALGSVFPHGSDFKLEIYDASGKLLNSQKVYISIIEGEMELEIRADLSRINFPKLQSDPINIAFFNGSKFEFDLGDLLTDSDFEISFKDGKIIAKIGRTDNDWSHKNFYKGKWGATGKKIKIRMIGNESIDLLVFGEVEIPIETLKNGGEWEGAFGFEITGSASEISRNTKKLYTIADMQHQLAIGVIPVVVKAKISAGLESKVSGTGHTDNWLDIDWNAVSITPQCAIRGAAGVGAAKVANICLYGEGKGDLKFNLFPVYNLEPKITLDFGIEVEAGWFKFNQSVITAVFPEEAANRMLMSNLEQCGFVPIGRDYLNNQESEWLGGQGNNSMRLASEEITNKNKTILLTNAFPNAYADIEDNLLLFTKDDLSRTAINAPKLVYATKVNDVWTAPIPIEDDETADGYFSLAKGYSTFAAWENIKEVIPEGTEMKDAYGKSEIKVGKFNGSAWDTTTLTDDSIADFQPQIRVSGNQAVCAWLSNTANDIFCTGGTTDLNYAVYNGYSWGGVQTISDVGQIAGFSVAYNGMDIYFALDKDVDGDNTTIEDREIYINQAGYGKIRVTDNNVLDQGCELTYHDNKFKLVWLTEEGIKIIDDICNMASVTTITDNFIGGYGVKIARNNDKMNLFWQEEKDGFTNLYGAYYIDGKWSKKTEVLTGAFDVKNFDAYLAGDGSFSVSYLERDRAVNESGEMVPGSADLCVLDIEPSYNLAVSNPYYNDDQYYGKSQTTFSCDVTVTGEKPIEGVTLYLIEGDSVIAQKQYTDVILPGETKEFSLMWQPFEFGTAKNLVLKALPNITEDFDLRDNTVDIRVGYVDLAVGTTYFEKEEEGYRLNSYISNVGSIPLDRGTFKLKDQNKNVVYSEEITNIDVDKIYLVQHFIPTEEPLFIDGVAKYYAEVETLNEESAVYNNREMAVITQSVTEKRDLNSDGAVDVRDLALLARDWGLRSGHAGFNKSHDLNSDGTIDLYDLVLIAKGISIQFGDGS